MKKNNQPKYVALYRVSTNNQKERKLGLLSQRGAIANYIKANNGVLLNQFEEIQSAGNKDVISYGQEINLDSLLRKRPVLQDAIEYAKANKAVLLVKEISRLTRFSLLYEYLAATGVEFLSTDYPTDNSFMLGLRVKFYEQEIQDISKRTKAGLSKSTKAKGIKALENLSKINHKKRIAVLRSNAANNKNNIRAAGYVCNMINTGSTYQEVADVLNKEGFRTSRGFAFRSTTVKRLYDRVCN